MVVRTAADRILATVEFVTAEKENEYGPYKSVLFKRSDMQGDEAKVWRSMPPDQADMFSKGQRVHLVPTERKGKQTWDVELLPDSSPATAPSTASQSGIAHEALSLDQKKAIAAYIAEQADLYAYCLETAQSKIGASTDSETVRCMATTLYIAAQRRFSLA